MIIKAGDVGSENLTVIDSITGKELRNITKVDTETGDAECYLMQDDGITLNLSDGKIKIIPYPGKVVVIEHHKVKE